MSPLLIFALIVVAYVANSIKILNEYERGVILGLGNYFPHRRVPE